MELSQYQVAVTLPHSQEPSLSRIHCNATNRNEPWYESNLS